MYTQIDDTHHPDNHSIVLSSNSVLAQGLFHEQKCATRIYPFQRPYFKSVFNFIGFIIYSIKRLRKHNLTVSINLNALLPLSSTTVVPLSIQSSLFNKPHFSKAVAPMPSNESPTLYSPEEKSSCTHQTTCSSI